METTQGDLFTASPAPQASGSATSGHRPDRWWPASKYPGHDVAACRRCSAPIFRPRGDGRPEAPVLVYDAHRRELVPAPQCPGRSSGLTMEVPHG